MANIDPTDRSDMDEMLADIKYIQVSDESLAAIKSQDGFMFLSVELLKEAASLVAATAGIVPPDSDVWSRNDAIIVGNFVRLAKLLSAYLDQVCQKREEISSIISRLLFESVVNTRFLVKNASPELFESYIRHSLRHERKLRDVIRKNTSERGEEWPIERRMLESIERTAQKSGIAIDDVSPSQPKNWGDKNLYERAEDVGLGGTAYLGPYGGPSHSIHGGWMDLLEYHLEPVSSDFKPKFEWKRPRPQQVLVAGVLALGAARDYLVYLGCNDDAEIVLRIDAASEKLRMADAAHEQFLNSKK